ncbi:MAG: ABC transporter substrate-binding protein [Geminicoccaceae bacterium]
MSRFSRRDTLAIGAGAATTLAMGGKALRAEIPVADVAAPDLPIEDGASLTVLRPAKFVDPDETVFLANTKKFTEATGVEVKVEFESWEDLRPKTAVAANVGSGPDIIVGFKDDPHQFKNNLVDVTDIADYLGAKYGGWWPLAERMGKDEETGNWISLPIGASGGRIAYRKSWANEAGFDEVPTDHAGFLEFSQKMKDAGHPGGLALGNAVGDGNSWTHWLIWSHGAAAVDENDQVIINSPETIEALNYGKALYQTFIPGTLSWLDASNNKAYLAGQIGWTQNGISIYYAAKTSEEAAVQEIAKDTFHARMPIGEKPGRPTETALVVNSMVFDYTPYPNAAKAYLTFMMEKEQYGTWLEECIGYWNHPLKAYDESPVWTVDPKHEAYKGVFSDSLWDGYRGSLGEASQAVLADFVVVQMVASVCADQATPEEAAAEAERRIKRYYRS